MQNACTLVSNTITDTHKLPSILNLIVFICCSDHVGKKRKEGNVRDSSALMFNSEVTNKVNNWAGGVDSTVNKRNDRVTHSD